MGTPISWARAGRRLANADIRADIYSLGCTLYFLLTGRPPFDGVSSFDVLMKQQKRAPTSRGNPRRCTAGTDRRAAKMMKKDLNERYQSPAEVGGA